VTTPRRQFVRLGWMMLALSVASGFVWLVVLASRLRGQSLQAMAGGGVWKVLTETRFGNDWLVRAVLAVLIAISIKQLEPLRGSLVPDCARHTPAERSLCSPTRTALLTGRNHHMNNMGSKSATGFQGNTGVRLDSVAPPAEMLRLNGFARRAFALFAARAP
jgi:hypothetical protein